MRWWLNTSILKFNRFLLLWLLFFPFCVVVAMNVLIIIIEERCWTHKTKHMKPHDVCYILPKNCLFNRYFWLLSLFFENDRNLLLLCIHRKRHESRVFAILSIFVWRYTVNIYKCYDLRQHNNKFVFELYGLFKKIMCWTTL